MATMTTLTHSIDASRKKESPCWRIAVTRKLCGHSRSGDFAAFSFPLSSSQIASPVRALLRLDHRR